MTDLICEALVELENHVVDSNALLVVLANEPSCHSQTLQAKRVTVPGRGNGRYAFVEAYQVWGLSGILYLTPSLKEGFSCTHRPAQHKANPGTVQTLSE